MGTLGAFQEGVATAMAAGRKRGVATAGQVAGLGGCRNESISEPGFPGKGSIDYGRVGLGECTWVWN